MELTLQRTTRSEQSTIGTLLMNGVFECYVLEDKDRGLMQQMPIDALKKRKVAAKTAIPAGRYQVIINFSNRFKTYLPLLLNVPAYEGVRIHPGNTAADTEGCLLPGTIKATDQVQNSRAAFKQLLAKMKKAEQKEKIYITIQ